MTVSAFREQAVLVFMQFIYLWTYFFTLADECGERSSLSWHMITKKCNYTLSLIPVTQ